jgi:hypothetical protein
MSRAYKPSIRRATRLPEEPPIVQLIGNAVERAVALHYMHYNYFHVHQC